MANINLHGTIFNQTGYDSHTRQLVNALFKLNPSIHLETALPADYLRKSNSAEMQMLHTPYFYEGTNIMITLPPFYSESLSAKAKNTIGWVVWEGENVPKFWKPYLAHPSLSAIIAPSQHTARAITNSFPELSEKVHLIPHGVNTSLFQPKIRSGEDFVFVANKGWAQGMNDRGGIQFLLQAFCAEFKHEKNVKLIVKINMTYAPAGWSLPNEMSKLGISPDDADNVEFIVQNVDYNDMPTLYHRGDVFVSPTMGEAFNIPCLEAMACGLPVITTNYGGQTDFVKPENGWLVDYDLVDVTWDMQYEGNRWAKPKVEHLRRVMRDAFINRNSLAKKKENARKTAEQYTWENSAKKLLRLISYKDLD